jgi:hypothetical protein
MDVISILQKKRQEVTSFDVHVHTDRAHEHPKVFTRAIITYELHGRSLDEAAVLRAIELSATKYCPAHAMLSKAFPIEMRYQIFEEGGAGPLHQTRLPNNVFVVTTSVVSVQSVREGIWEPALFIMFS